MKTGVFMVSYLTDYVSYMKSHKYKIFNVISGNYYLLVWRQYK